ERIDPAVVIPVIHVLFERNDLCPGDRLPRLQFLQQRIRGRTRGATLGGEQLNDHGLASRLIDSCLRFRFCRKGKPCEQERERQPQRQSRKFSHSSISSMWNLMFVRAESY